MTVPWRLDRGPTTACGGNNMSDVSAIEREFNAAAATYENCRLAPWYQAHAEEILKLIDRDQDGAIVDIGCGTGWFLRKVLVRCPRAHGFGVDVSGNMIEVARTKAVAMSGAGLIFIKADWEAGADAVKAALAGRVVKIIVCASVFHYFFDPRGTARRIHETLAPGGRLLLLERAKDRSALTLVWDLLHKFLIKDAVRFYNASDLLALLRDAGFRNVQVRREIRKLLWKRKFFTSVVLISADKA